MNKSSLLVLRVLSVSALFFFLIIYFLKPIETEDVWWHLSTGKYIVENHHVPHFDPFPFAQEKTPWVFTSWLGSVILFSIDQLTGLFGLQIFRIVISLLILFIFFLYGYRKIQLVFLISIIFCMSFGLEMRAFLRPDLFNYIFIQILLILLLKYEEQKQGRWLMAISFLGIIWSNIHLGSFIYGGLILFLFVFAKMIRYLGEKFSRSGAAEKEEPTLEQVKEVTIYCIAYFLAFCISPYGFKGFLYPWEVFFVPQSIDLANSLAVIEEVRPPQIIFSFSGAWFFILLSAGTVALVLNKERNLFQVLLFIFAVFMFVFGARASAFFVLIAGYIIIENLSAIQKIREYKEWPVPLIEVVIGFLIIFFAGINITHAVNKKVFYEGQWKRVIALQEDIHAPKKAIQLLKENGIQGKIFNAEQYGGYMIWHGYPSLQPFVDGRRINRREWSVFHPAVFSPERHWKKADQEYNFDIVMISDYSTFYAKLSNYLIRDPSWQLIFVDGNSIIFVKRGRYTLPENFNIYENALESVQVDRKESEKYLNRPLIKGLKGKFNGFLFPSPVFVDIEEESIALYDLGFKEAGIAKMLKALEINDTVRTREILKMMIAN